MPTYHFDQTYDWNYENGPDFKGEFPQLKEDPKFSFLGHALNSPLGITAGILLNSKWVSTYAKLGYDILTYKTVRSAHRECYPLPNWVFLECDAPLEPGYDHPLIASLTPRRPFDKLTSSVCFGMPSMAPEVWRDDVAKAKDSLGKGQMLNVSVVGTPNESGEMNALANDYAQCAKWAVDSGADAVEANLSCPNVNTAEGQIYHNKENTIQILETIRNKIPDSASLLVKIGILPDVEQYEQFLNWTQPYAQGISLVNCLQRRIHDPKGAPIFGKKFDRAGVLGWATFQQCLTHLRTISQAKQNTNSNQVILACGGVITVNKALMFRDSGADAIMMGGAPVFDPHLATQIKEHFHEPSQ